MTLQECIETFLEHVKALKVYDEKDVDGFSKEFRKLINKSKKNLTEKTFPVTHGEAPFNLSKNRYKDILPYDHSRVTLSVREGEQGSDYMNANFIEGATGHQAYIASQGPLPSTVNDFWRMLWEYQTHVVIMACNEYEGIKLKCQRYWPQQDEEMNFNGIKVKLVEQQNSGEFNIRVIQATVQDEVRLLYQFHYTTWPDHGTPTNLERILDMMAMVRQYQRLDQPPIVVHCSAGCGRTGTILAIDYVWSLLKLGKLEMDFCMYKVIAKFRTQRQSMVQSEDQYIFVHLAVQELFERHLNLLEDHLYENVLTLNGATQSESADEVGSDEELYQDIDTAKAAAAKVASQAAANRHSSILNRPVVTPPVSGIVRPAPPSHQSSVASTASSTSPKPPPKPSRTFQTDESPTKAVIMETLQRLMSGSDMEDDLYANTPVFTLKTPVPRSKRNSNKASGITPIAESAASESAPAKPALSQKPAPPQKPAIMKKPTTSSRSSESDDAMTGSKETSRSSDVKNDTSSAPVPKSSDIKNDANRLSSSSSRSSDTQNDSNKDISSKSSEVKNESSEIVRPRKQQKEKKNYENITFDNVNKMQSVIEDTFEGKPNYENVSGDFSIENKSIEQVAKTTSQKQSPSLGRKNNYENIPDEVVKKTEKAKSMPPVNRKQNYVNVKDKGEEGFDVKDKGVSESDWERPPMPLPGTKRPNYENLNPSSASPSLSSQSAGQKDSSEKKDSSSKSDTVDNLDSDKKVPVKNEPDKKDEFLAMGVSSDVSKGSDKTTTGCDKDSVKDSTCVGETIKPKPSPIPRTKRNSVKKSGCENASVGESGGDLDKGMLRRRDGEKKHKVTIDMDGGSDGVEISNSTRLSQLGSPTKEKEKKYQSEYNEEVNETYESEQIVKAKGFDKKYEPRQQRNYEEIAFEVEEKPAPKVPSDKKIKRKQQIAHEYQQIDDDVINAKPQPKQKEYNEEKNNTNSSENIPTKPERKPPPIVKVQQNSCEYQEVEYDIAMEKPKPLKLSESKSGSVDQDDDMADYAYVSSTPTGLVSTPKHGSAKSSVSSNTSQQQHLGDHPPQQEADNSCSTSEEEESADEGVFEPPPVPKKNFSSSDESRSIASDELNFITKEEQQRIMQQKQEQSSNTSGKSHKSSSSSKTLGRKMGEKLDKFKNQKLFKVKKGSSSGGGISGGGAGVIGFSYSALPAMLEFNWKDKGFGNRVGKPVGPSAEGQGHRRKKPST